MVGLDVVDVSLGTVGFTVSGVLEVFGLLLESLSVLLLLLLPLSLPPPPPQAVRRSADERAMTRLFFEVIKFIVYPVS